MDTIDLLSLGLKSNFDDREASIDTSTSLDYIGQQDSVIIANVKLNSQTSSKTRSSSSSVAAHDFTNGEDSVIVANIKPQNRSGKLNSDRKRQTFRESSTPQKLQIDQEKNNAAVDNLNSNMNDDCSIDLEALTYYPPEPVDHNDDDFDDDAPLLPVTKHTARSRRRRTGKHKSVDHGEDSSFRPESLSESEFVPLKKFRPSSPSSSLKRNSKLCQRYREKQVFPSS